MKLRKTLALLALVAGGLMVQPVALAEGWFNDLDDAKEATLSELVSRPHDFLDVAVKIEVYFDRTVSNYNPYYTRFSDNVYGNVAAWPIDARLYEKRDFGRSYPFFFVQRMNKNWRKISSLSGITPIEAVVVVRDIFRGQPWIEILGYKTISKGMRASDVKNLVRGDAYMRTARYAEAAASYRKVNEGRAPANVRVDIYRKRADAHFYAANYRASAANYRAALKLSPGSKVLEQGHAAAKDMAERKKKPDLARERANVTVAPAPSHVPVNDAVNGVDAIIAAMEDPATVKAQVEQDRLDMEKRAARVRDPDTVTVSDKKEEGEGKEAAAEGDDEVSAEDGVVVKDGVVEGEEGCGEETADESDESAPADGEETEKVEKEGVVEEETDDGVRVEEAEAEEVEEPAEEGCAEVVEEGCAEEATEEDATDDETVEEGCAEETTEDAKDDETVEEGCAEEATEEDATDDETVEEGCAEETTEEDATDDETVEEGCSEEVDESQEAEEVVEEETAAEEPAKDNEVRPGEILVQNGEPVVAVEVVEEQSEGCGDEAVEESEDGCATEETTEDAKDDETVEEGYAEETTEDAKDDETVEEGCTTEETTEEDATDDETVEEGCAEETTEEDATDDETVEEGCAEEATEEDATDDETVEEGCSEDVDESQEAEDVVVEDGEVEIEEAVKEAVAVRKTVDQLPRLPFFGCEGVTEAQLRAVIEEVLNNPEF